MRSEKEIYDLILNFAENDARIRAVSIGGSRVNPNVPKDIFQDYDISFFVTDMDSFISDNHWIDIFGKRIIMQKPEAMSLFPPELGNWFTYLMLFEDGNRIDLCLIPVDETELYLKSDKLVKILLDKDNLFPPLPTPSDENYHVKKPSKEFYADCCNEFWWVSTYVAKGLWRNEILYANHHLEQYVRSCLLRMMEWRAGLLTGFTVSTGKNYKYLSRYLSPEEWSELMSTYKCSNNEECWQSLFTIIKLFRSAAQFVAKELGYEYNKDDDDNVSKYLIHVQQLSQSEL